MAFDKLIISSITNSAKSGIKMDLAVDSLKEKFIDTASSKIEDQIPINLPFSPREVLLGGALPSVTPELISTLPPIPESQKQQISDTLDSIESSLNSVIQQKNTLQGSLNTITTPLTTVEGLADTLGGVITGLKTAVTVIKLIPIPTSVPPGVGIPVNVINGFSDALDTLKTILDKFGGPLEVIPQAVSQINGILTPLIEKLNLLDPIFEKVIKIIAFIRTLLLYGPNATQQEIDSVLSEIASNTQQSLTLTGSTSNPGVNAVADEALLQSLNSGTLSYKGFKLTIETDPNNEFSFPARRVKGVSFSTNLQGITIYNLADDGYSFSASTTVLVDEVKFRIDGYLNYLRSQNPELFASLETQSQSLPPSTENLERGILPPFDTSGIFYEIRRLNNKFYQLLPKARFITGEELWGITPSKEIPGSWVEFTPDFTPFSTPGGKNGDERTQFKVGYQNIYKWVEIPTEGLPPRWVLDRTEY